jgi:formylglycine-generating enzyme required for sulfatase activity
LSSIEKDIEKGKRKRRMMAIVSCIGVVLIGIVYFGWLFMTKGYSFTVMPQEAAMTQRFSTSSGMGFFIENKFYVIGSEAKVTVSAIKYQSKTIGISISSPINIEVELEPLPATFNIDTSPKLQNVDWLVNGKSYGASSSLEGDFEPGDFTVIASHPSYESGSVSFKAENAAAVKHTISLTPISGTLRINSKPSGASVTIDGESIGTTPVALQKMGGTYDVVLARQGYQLVTDTVAITKANKRPTRNYNLTPLQAILHISTSPSGGALLVNSSPIQSPVSVDANKRHEVRYEKAGYLPQNQSVTLDPAEKASISFSLKPEMGNVRFEASENASVFVNGVNKGQPPLSLSLQALSTTVEFRKSGYRTVKKVFIPSHKMSLLISAEMVREFDARRREGKPLFVSTLNIEMTQISPKAFTMGSARNEPNRKSNEQEVAVDFSRKVWISRHEISQAQYNAFSQVTGGSKMPVTNVSWSDAAQYTNWLSEQEGLLPFYLVKQGEVVGTSPSSRGYRLPTEAEWEYIAKINRRSKPTMYVWGTQAQIRDKQGNFADESLKGQQTFILKGYNDGFAGVAPIGSFKADRGGFFDLDGNVREWVHDKYTVVPVGDSKVFTDYIGPSVGQGNVVKGGSFKTGRMKNIRTSIRSRESTPTDDIGFRIARYHK